MSLGTTLIANRKLKGKLGPPDVYPQDPNQKEDELSAVHVKQGFTTSYANLVNNDEYGSALTKVASLNQAKIWNDFKDILSKKEELNTLQETKDKNKRQPVNIRDDFWLVTGKTKPQCEKFFKELAGGKPLSVMAKKDKVPIFNRNEDIVLKLYEFDVTFARGVWLIKMHAAYKCAMQEANKSKKRGVMDPSSEWTISLTRYITQQREELAEIVKNSSGGGGERPPGVITALEEVKPENSTQYKLIIYMKELCWVMYGEGLLDRQEFLQWILDTIEKNRDPEDPLFRMMMPLLTKYSEEFIQNELLARKLSYQCAKKITSLVLETESYAANNDPNNPAHKDKVIMIPGSNQPLPPTFAGLMELQRDKEYNRMTIMTLSNFLMIVSINCPTALVWHYWSEIKTPTSLLGSPMDCLPDIAPHSLPTPTRADTQELRDKVKTSVMFINERSAAVYNHWSSTGSESAINSTYGTVGKILTVLEELDRFVFDRSDSSNSIDVLHSRLWGEVSGQQGGQGVVSQEDEAVVMTLCEWAVTNNRSGEHRAFVAAKLLEQRQTDLLSPDSGEEKEESEEIYFTGPPVFQNLLFKFLDSEAPYFRSLHPNKLIKNEVANLILLYHELMAHDVYSHDAYLCTLISRGDLTTPLQRTSTSESGPDNGTGDVGVGVAGTPQGPSDVWRYNRHWQFTYHFPIPFSHEDSVTHDINQRHVLLYGSGRGRDETSKQVKKLTKEIQRLFSKKFAVDVAEGGKVKKHHRSEFIFSEVVGKFQELSYFDQHAVTSQCGQTVIEMVHAFHSCSGAIHLPVTEHVSFLFDLAGQAFNIQTMLEWCIALLKELPLVESQLMERGSVLTRTYTTNLALYIVGVLKRYHAVLILSEADVRSVWDSLVKISYRHSTVPQESPRHESSGSRRPPPNLDCNSAEWCIMGYLHDLAISCPVLKTSDVNKDKYQVLRRLFNYSPEPSLSPYPVNEQFIDMFKIYIKDPKNRKVDPLIVRYLHEKPENQYSLVVSVLCSVINDQLDTETLNNLAILCCELTAQCSTLAQEWLGALFALCCSNDAAYVDLITSVNLKEPIHDRLGVFVSILIARQCFSLQSFVVQVVTRSLVKAWNEGKGDPGREAEAGARLSLHLLRKLFGTVESFQPCFYTIASPRAYPVNPLGIKLSCDRHLLAATHANISSGILVGAIIAVLKALLVLGHSASKGPRDVSTLGNSLGEDELAKLPLGDLATWTLYQTCGQEWVRDRCLQVPDELLKQGILLDPFLKPAQAQHLLQLICHMPGAAAGGRKLREPGKAVTHIIEELDEWSLRASMVDIKLMYHRLEDRKGEWVEEVSRCIVDSFQLGDNDDTQNDNIDDDSDSEEPRPKKARLDTPGPPKHGQKKQKYGPIWMVAHLVKHLKFLQPKILKVAASVLEIGNWSRNSKQRVASGHQPFLQLILTCLRETEHSEKDKNNREEREQEKEHLLQSLHLQLSTFICFDMKDKLYNYEDPTARKTMQDALQLRFSLVGGMFESITTTMQSITDWSTLLVQLVVKGVIDLTNNSDLYCMLVDMLAIMIHSTLIIDKEVGGSDRAEENKRSYHTLVKKLKKEIGDKHNKSIKFVRQLLPIPKQLEEVIVTEQYGLIPTAKGIGKERGVMCDKKQGLQVAEKQKVSPWDILEGHKNPAPLSWHWFQAVKTERKPMRYEEAFQNMKYMKNTMEKPASYYLEDPPLPPEDLQPTKDTKEDMEKNLTGAGGKKPLTDSELQQQLNSGKRGAKGMPGAPRGPRQMSPLGVPGTPGGPIRGQGGTGGMYGQPQQSGNVGGYIGQNNSGGFSVPSGPMGPNGPSLGQSGPMNYGQNNPYGNGQSAPPGGGMQPGTMQGAGPGPRFPGPGGMAGASNSSKQALQNMLRARHPSPGGGFVGAPSQQMGPMGMRPGGQYSSMMPASQTMGGMSRPMYPGGQAMGSMTSGYGGMQGNSNYGGYGGSNPQMRMNTPTQSMGGMRPSGQQYGMQGTIQQGMGMSGMGMPRAGMGMSGGPNPGYGMGGGSRPQGYGMQSSIGMGSSMGGPGMMRPQGMRPMGPGMMSGMQGGSGMGSMQTQGGMAMQGGSTMGMQGSGGMPGMGNMSQTGMQGGPNMQGNSQLMAQLQRGGGGMGTGGQGMGYQQNRF